ncbi:class I SAM-dependent methyltransferase [Candidatus Viridilinea mediisalina]|uniref:Methyltransferase type 11 n=1 Tax=Candidatus Viridilinea mediisalina TaxID=2024553 RepID=A0A2A6RDR5_9CHLR|nr:class I SAM-dependent methyltransferase [Candidatus Viridilinea mediisalina]PDW00151.1 methyltransferase type 11 [Candidatus Viridilinea mediisalina]
MQDYLRPHLLTLPIHRAMIRSIEARLFAELAPELPEPIFDLGSGDGTFVEIALPGKQVYGIDPLLRDTREAAGRGVYAGLSVANGRALPFADGQFASAISNCVLEHIIPLDETLAETARVLRPRGLFVASVVGERFAHDLLGTWLLERIGLDGRRYGNWFNRISYHFNTLSQRAWSERFAQAGFEVVTSRPYLSAAALKLFDFSHYYGAPTLLTKKLTGRWLVAPPLSPNLLWEPILRPIYNAPAGADGPYYFFVLRKRA